MTDHADAPPDDFPPDDASGLSDAEVRELAARARATGDEPLRRLVASYLTLRRVAAETVTFIEAREGAQTVVRTTVFRRLRQLARRSAE